jgi:hypothetical protein
MSDQQKTTAPTSNSKTQPNDRAGLIFSGSVKIFDPNTKKVFVETRA